MLLAIGDDSMLAKPIEWDSHHMVLYNVLRAVIRDHLNLNEYLLEILISD